MVDRFFRLGHHAIISGHDENDDVRDLGAARAHHCEGFVTGRIEENDLPSAFLYVIGADVLRDTTRLAARDVGLADGVEK